jgi:hypothetical protein
MGFLTIGAIIFLLSVYSYSIAQVFGIPCGRRRHRPDCLDKGEDGAPMTGRARKYAKMNLTAVKKGYDVMKIATH